MVRPRREGAGPRSERVGGARMRLQAPRLARRLVDRATHDRVAERVVPRHRGGAQHVERRELLEPGERLLLAEVRGRGGELELGGIARDRRAPGEPSRRVSERRDLLPERG